MDTSGDGVMMEKECAVSKFVRDRIRILGKQQTEIAAECGFVRPNMITMIKQGKTKLPLGKVGVMARALEADPVHLLKLCLSEYQPENWVAIEPLLDLALTNDERKFLNHLRIHTGEPYLTALSEESQRLITQFLQSLRTSAGHH
jgi:hypothetical protein